ncbi:sigma-54 dependent transcriptional regulator [Candidatus Nitronereus thalassa]|uniref:Sigma-54 dependent transcriptional regulator n=1 Tax=Candidatus Nitronereus thalassa TaxID=3020898 RepID=A0ABU3KCC3_9BACT|nr:sigma-54 dependent transcriptional regulator [Candidatus Nitronereus thalassa]MDT7044159.1 sigma-54 dependent transcriptional regulator [Candidatus Nitronereus thalassa]
MSEASVLIIDDEPLMRLSMVDALKAVGYQVQEASTGDEGIERSRTSRYDVVITDLRMPGSTGLQVVQACKEFSSDTEVVVITAHGSVETAVQAMKLGAYDYITKPFSMDELLLTVDRATQVVALRKENTALRQELEGKFSFEGIVGKHDRMRQVIEKIKLVSTTDATVLITGESGTGKEVFANAIHRNSPRREYALIKVSCAALPETLLEAELFGHEKGAFTGALKQRRGRFELAHKGTLFLDEIGEISPMVQVKLLRVLQERQFERVGGTETVECDVRLVCATQKDLKKEVDEGRFREDLYYRLHVVQVRLPPLRERKEDILVLADHLLHSSLSKTTCAVNGFSPQAREVLLRYSFPGNVRELENTIERGVALAQNKQEIEVWDLCGHQGCPFLGGTPQEGCGFCQEGLCNQPTPSAGDSSGISSPMTGTLAEVREKIERDYIVEVLNRTEWSRTIAAKSLGLSRKALWEKCKRYGISDSVESEE